MGENSLVFTTSGAILPHLHSATRVPAKSEWTGLLHMVPCLHSVLRDSLCDAQSHRGSCSGPRVFWRMTGTTRTFVMRAAV